MEAELVCVIGGDQRYAMRLVESWKAYLDLAMTRRAAMEHYVGLDVSLKLTATCIVDRAGKVEREGMVHSDPEAIAAFIKSNATDSADRTRSGSNVDVAVDRAE